MDASAVLVPGKEVGKHKALDSGHHTRIYESKYQFLWVPEVPQVSQSSGKALVIEHKGTNGVQTKRTSH